jgi:hypothetical protein
MINTLFENNFQRDFGVQSFSFGRGFPKLKLWTPKYIKIKYYNKPF